MESSGKAERLESRVCIEKDFAEDIVIDSLGNLAGESVHDQSRTACLIGNDAVGGPAFDHVVGCVEMATVDKTGDEIAVAVQLGNGVERILVQEALSENAVDFLADAAVAPVNEVLNAVAVWQDNGKEVAELIVAVARSIGPFGLAFQVTAGAVTVGCGAIPRETVLAVVIGAVHSHYPSVTQAVAVCIVSVHGDRGSVTLDFLDAAGHVIRISISRCLSCQGFGFFTDAPQPVAAILNAI